MEKGFESRMFMLLAYVMLVLVAGAAAAQAAAGVVTKPIIAKDSASMGQQTNQTCHDGKTSPYEQGIDCGGLCVTNDTETCDGIDNDRDCYIDEGVVCDAEKKTISGQEQQESEEVGQQPSKNITGSNADNATDLTAVSSAVESVGETKTAMSNQGSTAGGAASGSSADSVAQESSGTSALGNAGGAESPPSDDKQDEPDGKPGSSKELAIPLVEHEENSIGATGDAKSEKEVKTVSDAEEGSFFKKLFKKFFRLFGGKS